MHELPHIKERHQKYLFGQECLAQYIDGEGMDAEFNEIVFANHSLPFIFFIFSFKNILN